MHRSEKLRGLKKAREFLKIGWCQGPVAMNADGDNVTVLDPSACKWCAYGAIIAAARSIYETIDEQWDMVDKVRAELHSSLKDHNNYPDIVEYNEKMGRKKSDIMAIFDETINRLEENVA